MIDCEKGMNKFKAAERSWLDVQVAIPEARLTMSANPRCDARKRNPPATRRRALELLASRRDGCTEALMLAHGGLIRPQSQAA
jgi:hypothetical protein